MTARRPTPIAIRPFRESDLDRAVELELANFSHYPLARRQLRYHLNNPNAIFLVADRAGQVVGDTLGLLRRHPAGLSGRIYTLVVDQNHRGEGIGRLLFQSVVRKLRARGAHRIYLEVAHKNAGAIALYERSGFRSVGVLNNYYARGEHAIHMVSEAPIPRS